MKGLAVLKGELGLIVMLVSEIYFVGPLDCSDNRPSSMSRSFVFFLQKKSILALTLL